MEVETVINSMELSESTEDAVTERIEYLELQKEMVRGEPPVPEIEPLLEAQLAGINAELEALREHV